MGTMIKEEYNTYIKKVYARWAQLYDAGTFFLSATRNKVVRLAGAPLSSNILDVATGTGRQAFAFGKLGYQVVGIDLSEDMLRIAQKHNRYHNLRLEVADATSLPFQDNEFDVSTVSWALHDMPREVREKVLREMGRVTKKNGSIIVVDYASPENGFRWWLINRFIRSVESLNYSEYIQSGLKNTLIGLGFKIEKTQPIVLGLGIIVKVANVKS